MKNIPSAVKALYEQKVQTVIKMLLDANLEYKKHYKLIKKNKLSYYTDKVIIHVFSPLNKDVVETTFRAHKLNETYYRKDRSIMLFLENIRATTFSLEKKQDARAPETSEKNIQSFYKELENIHNSCSLLGTLLYEEDGDYVYKYFNESEACIAFDLLQGEVSEANIDTNRTIVSYTVDSIANFPREFPDFKNRDWIKGVINNFHFRNEIVSFISVYVLEIPEPKIEEKNFTGFSQRIDFGKNTKKCDLAYKIFSESFGFGVLRGGTNGDKNSLFVSLVEINDHIDTTKPFQVLLKANLDSREFHSYMISEHGSKNYKELLTQKKPVEMEETKNNEQNFEQEYLSENFEKRVALVRSEISRIIKKSRPKGLGLGYGIDSKKESLTISFFAQKKDNKNEVYEKIPAFVESIRKKLPNCLNEIGAERSLRFDLCSTTKGKPSKPQIDVQTSSPIKVKKTVQKNSPKVELTEIQLSENQYRNMFNRIPSDMRDRFVTEMYPVKGLRVDEISPIESITFKLFGEETTLLDGNFHYKLNTIK